MSPRERHVSIYSGLSRAIQDQGLLRRRYGYYWGHIIAAIAAFAGVWVAVVVLGNSWWTLVPAAVLAVVSAQFGFLAHDLAHRQVFASPGWNAWMARVLSGLFAGLSYGWWKGKHTKHHNAPTRRRACCARVIPRTSIPASCRRHVLSWRAADSRPSWHLSTVARQGPNCCGGVPMPEWEPSTASEPLSRLLLSRTLLNGRGVAP